ncbi:MAG: hypothetical protein QCI00_10105, partial [Candidatus Thermoplasmatota archaeon]|nr:hypothetical protein [Candidatus Thermoplasmatota archaeon]
ETVIIPDGEGWVAIQSHDHPEGYWFLLIASNVGDGFCYRKGYTPNEVIGDVALEFYEYELDTTPPEVSFDQPKESTIYLNNVELFTWPFPNAVIIGNIDIIVNASDPGFAGMDYVELFIDDESKVVLDSEPYVWNWGETGFGVFTIRAEAFDKAGNSETVEITAIKIF